MQHTGKKPRFKTTNKITVLHKRYSFLIKQDTRNGLKDSMKPYKSKNEDSQELLLMNGGIYLKKKRDKPEVRFSVFENVIFILKDVFKYYKPLMALLIVEAVLGVVTSLLGIYLPKLAVELVTTKKNLNQALFSLVILAIILTIAVTLQSIAASAKYQYQQNMSWHYMRELFFKTLNCDYLVIESEKGHTRYQKARRSVDGGESSGTSVMISSMLSLFTGTMSFILFSSIIAILNPFIIFLVVGISAVNYFALCNAKNYEQNNKNELAKLENKLDYIENTCGDVKAAKDVRVYALQGWFIFMHEQLTGVYTLLKQKIQNRHFISFAVNAITLLLRDGIAYAYLIWCVTHGQITIDYFVLYLGAITGLSGWISQVVGNLNAISSANLKMNDVREFLENTDAPESDNPQELPKAGSGVSIEFRDVCYSYYQGSKDILNHFDLKIEHGETLALVGVNGAGKTTIVKLLCGFYRPDSGEILINKIDIKMFRKKDLFKMFSVIFQDIMLLPFTVAENISMKAESEIDMERVAECLNKVGLTDEINKYEKGIDSMMTKYLDTNGIMLSGGQQQKLLMARALYKDAPILVLDEPTAALDPIAENEVYESFNSSAKGKTVVFISHRLASTRFCDKIIMLSEGKIIESGTHEELINKQGSYADMFNIQSQYYNDTSKEVHFEKNIKRSN